MGQLICRNKKYSPDENDNGDKISKSQKQGSIPKSASRCPTVEDRRTREENAGRVPGTQNASLGNAVNVYGSDEVPDEASQKNIVKEQTVNGSDEVSQKNIVKEQTVNGSDEVSQKNIVNEQTVNGSDEVYQKKTVKGRREYSRQKNISRGGPQGSDHKSARCHSCGDSQRDTLLYSRQNIQTANRQEVPKPIPKVVKSSPKEKILRDESPLVSSSKGSDITFTGFFSILSDGNRCNCSDASIAFPSSNISTEMKSKCEIYSNKIELTLKRAVQKRGLPQSANQTHITKPLPSCLEKLEHCTYFRSLFRKIGELAFESLFNSDKRQMLIMDEEFIGMYLTQEELKLCLELGFLNQEKENNDSCRHKTMHEFFAALYLYLSGTKVLDIMVQKCNSLSVFLEMSDIFVFISGFDSELYYKLSCRIVKTVMQDNSIKRYRKSCYYDEDSDFKLVLNFQNLQTKCAREIKLNGHEVPPLPLQDIIINEDTKSNDTLNLVQKITRTCPEKIKSLYIYGCETTKEVAEILKQISFHSLQRLQKLFLPYVLELDEEQILFGPQTTLQTLSLVNIFYFGKSYVRYPAVLSPCFREYLQNMSKLQALYLDAVSLDYAQLQQILKIITLRNTMTRIGLYKIECNDRNDYMNCVELDLSHHTNLVQLHLHDVPISQVNLNTQHLEEIVIGGLGTNVVKSLLLRLPEAHRLRRLSCNHFKDDTLADMVATIPTLVQLEDLHIQLTNIDDRLFLLSPDMTRLRRIELWRVFLRSTVLEDLAKTLLNLSLSVTVHLKECIVTPMKDFQTFNNIMKSSKQFVVLADRLDSNEFFIYTFKTNP